MKNCLTKIILFLLILFPAQTVFAFSDVSDTPYEDAINFLAEKNVVQGYSDETYRPYNSINRAEFTKILMETRYPGESYGTYCFPDVETDWYAPYICEAKSRGIVSGYPDDYFRPNNNINLAEALKVVLETYDAPVEDIYSVWYENYYWFAEPNGLLDGIDKTIGRNINRGDMAQLIYNVETYYEDGDDTQVIDDPAVDDPVSEIPNTDNLNGLCYDIDCLDKNPNYIIITRPLFLDTIQDFVEWKGENNFEVGVLTVEFIVDEWSQENPTKSIKEAIKYFSNFKNTDYFLLIGDTIANYEDNPIDLEGMYNLDYEWNVPSGYYCALDFVDFDENEQRDGINDYSRDCLSITDIYYADFDEGWEENEDGYIVRGSYYNDYWYDGEKFRTDLDPGDDPLLMVMGNEYADPLEFDFETIVGRIPIRKPDEFQNIFNKMQNYELNLPSVHYWRNNDLGNSNYHELYCSFAGVSEEDFAKHDNTCSEDTVLLGHLLNANGVTFVEQAFDLSSDIDKEEVRNKLFGERRIVIPLFHGAQTFIEVLLDSEVDKFKYIFPMWVEESCNIGAFARYDYDSLAESLLKAEKGPAFVVGPLNHYFFFKGLLDGKSVGEAFYNVGEVIVRYSAVSDNLFGDPSLKLFE